MGCFCPLPPPAPIPRDGEGRDAGETAECGVPGAAAAATPSAMAKGE